MCEPKPDELEKTACVVNASVRTIGVEQLRRWLSDHRFRLQKSRFELLQTAARMEKEIATVDAMLADLKIG